MNINKLAPWNWFKKEEELGPARLPVRRGDAGTEPSYPVDVLRHEMDRLFDRFLRDFGVAPSRWSSGFSGWEDSGRWIKPSLDISADEKEYTLQVELPGISEADVRIDVTGDMLKIHGEKSQASEDKGRDYYAVERSYGSFQRVLALPEDSQPDGIGAACENGVLTVRIPRRQTPSAASKRIEVKSAH